MFFTSTWSIKKNERFSFQIYKNEGNGLQWISSCKRNITVNTDVGQHLEHLFFNIFHHWHSSMSRDNGAAS